MGDSYNNPQQNGRDSRDGSRSSFRGGRGPTNREGGGFRIRLSENEMRSARTIQEAFNLRSTVAVLGFAVRTLGEMLEQGKLDDFVNQYRAEGPRINNPQSRNNANNKFNSQRAELSENQKPNPFARPTKPDAKIQPDDSSESNEPQEEGKEDLIGKDEVKESNLTEPNIERSDDSGSKAQEANNERDANDKDSPANI